MVERLIANITDFVMSYTIHDFIGLVAAFLLFILTLTFTILFKNSFLKFLMFLITISILLTAPIGIKIVMDKTIRASEINITEQKRLAFVDTLIIDGSVKNIGLINFKNCKIKATIVKENLHPALKYLFKYLQPLYYKVENLQFQSNLNVGESRDFRLTLDNFLKTEKYELMLDTECR